MIGHAPPGELTIERGQLLHVDFGVSQNGYCSDLQRVWYFLEDGETEPPADVLRPGATSGPLSTRESTSFVPAQSAGRSMLRPAPLVAAGYPEPKYSLGHQLGRAAHDGGTLLGPRWERYGDSPLGTVEAGNVFTLEYGVHVPDRGYIGLEEDVLVTEARRVAELAAADALGRRVGSPRPSSRKRGFDEEATASASSTSGRRSSGSSPSRRRRSATRPRWGSRRRPR